MRRTDDSWGMKCLCLAALCALLVAAGPTSVPADTPHWGAHQLSTLLERMRAAPADGLFHIADATEAVERAQASGDSARIDAAATQAANALLEAERHGCCGSARDAGWRIDNGLPTGDHSAELAAALDADEGANGAADGLNALFDGSAPQHPNFLALKQAYQEELDPARRATIVANMDRWRWMPRDLGPLYLLVNTAAFEATLWEQGRPTGRWAVIVGKTRSPTPVFSASVTGVVFNPWWEIPPSIVAESVGALVRKHPAEAARRGYVVQNGRYRQRPGPGNSLGRMKLIMPNPYNVYLHDTPLQELFQQDMRAHSHGCVRVRDALGLAATVLRYDRAAVDEIVEAGKTVALPVPQPIPIYVAYFTAEPDDLGNLRFFPDVYGRDKRAGAVAAAKGCTR